VLLDNKFVFNMETGTFLGVKSDFTPRKPPLYSE